MKSFPMSVPLAIALGALVLSLPVQADENLFGYVRGAEVLPKGSSEVYQWVTQRSNKGSGTYRAIDWKTEFEHGLTDRFQVSAELNSMSINTSDLRIDGYLPQDKKFGFRLSGFELAGKYNFLSPAKDDFGLSGRVSLGYGTIDPHSGQRKTEYEVETQLIAQKYFFEGQLTWVANVGVSAAYEERKAIDNLSAGFDWPAEPEMEITTKLGTGLSYRFAPNWYLGAELLRESEYETEVGLERWSLFAGPTLHYGGKKFWTSLTYFHQVRGGGERYEGQADNHLHLIEKTRNEVRLKVGYNF
jgi:hypothetical protein